uniref:Uncharacterized protein n=1 Tax=Timema cristinae TaxID=61476 RepID=A0A7R9CN96_TIMCR|nr:unnamed protein product [Timema cristinae]
MRKACTDQFSKVLSDTEQRVLTSVPMKPLISAQVHNTAALCHIILADNRLKSVAASTFYYNRNMKIPSPVASLVLTDSSQLTYDSRHLEVKDGGVFPELKEVTQMQIGVEQWHEKFNCPQRKLRVNSSLSFFTSLNPFQSRRLRLGFDGGSMKDTGRPRFTRTGSWFEYSSTMDGTANRVLVGPVTARAGVKAEQLRLKCRSVLLARF